MKRRGGLIACLAVLLAWTACKSPFPSELDPRPLNAEERGEYMGPPPVVTGDIDADGTQIADVERLARVFYTRLIHRRFNSIATFHDPALREFFGTPESFADFFAALADALSAAHFEALRPTALELEQLDVIESNAVLVTVRYHGENSLPLRFWSADLVRTDRWERSDDRWWIIPGKL